MRGIVGRADPRAVARARVGTPRGAKLRTMALDVRAIPPIQFAMQRMPYSENGATNWVAMVNVGTSAPTQTLKLALDTGGNFVWMMSTLCDDCSAQGRTLFNPYQSTTFGMEGTGYSKDFGPWGTMQADLGQDFLALPGGGSLYTPFYLSTHLVDEGGNFSELDWDGGLALPSIPSTADPNVPSVFPRLMNLGLIDPGMPYMSFCNDPASGTGQVLLGGVDSSKFDPSAGFFMPFTPYPGDGGQVEYIWTTSMPSFTMGGNVDVENGYLCLDTGSSCFKGDPPSMTQAAADGNGPNPPTAYFNFGSWQIAVPPDVYRVQIQKGPDQGQTLAQFTDMALTGGFVLAGSVLLDQLYAIYEYEVTAIQPTKRVWYFLYPKGMWLFNKVGGPRLIQPVGGGARKPKVFERKKVIAVAG